MAEKGLDIPVVQVDLANQEQHSDDFVAINPHRTVPVLELDCGTRLTTSMGIMHYLEAKYPQPALMGRTAVERGSVVDLDCRIEQEGFLAVGEAFRNRSKAFANNVLTGRHQHRQIPELVERGRARVTEFFDWLDDHLCGREHVAGDYFSVADITAFVTVDFAKWIRQEPAIEQAELRRWYQQIVSRDSVQSTQP